jgi:precorrin-6A synthase
MPSDRPPGPRRILIIGIGAGNPEYITIQAINALKQVDVLFLTDKGEDKSELMRIRTEICERYIPGASYRIVPFQDPERDRAPASYRSAVEDWHDKRATLYEELIRDHLGEHECGAFLSWGDPTFYDSILRIIDPLSRKLAASFEYEVIPGISSFQALAARHRIPLNQIAEPLQITTGRRLLQTLAECPSATDVVVVLDGECSFRNIVAEDFEIYWGAYLGMPDEMLVSGKVRDVGPVIERLRAEARARKGWIMDTYLLRRRAT